LIVCGLVRVVSYGLGLECCRHTTLGVSLDMSCGDAVES
jgi:hypothetical protein